MTFAENSLTRIFNLDLLREIMAMLNATNNKMALYKQYFSGISSVLGENLVEANMTLAEGDTSQIDENDEVFLLAEMGEMRMTRHLEADF
jgi:hypothetical protein